LRPPINAVNDGSIKFKFKTVLQNITTKLVSLVERMLELHKRTPKTSQEQELVKREIESTDVRIDRLVYELYGLTDEEIKIVES
jgi:hypothetical protein